MIVFGTYVSVLKGMAVRFAKQTPVSMELKTKVKMELTVVDLAQLASALRIFPVSMRELVLTAVALAQMGSWGVAVNKCSVHLK